MCNKTGLQQKSEFVLGYWTPFWPCFGPWAQTQAWLKFWDLSQSLPYQDDSARPVWPCLCSTIADVQLCHWPCQSLHTLCHPSLPPMSSYPTKNPPPYVLNLYKWEADAIKLSSCFDRLTAGVGFFWTFDTHHSAQPWEILAGSRPLSSHLDLMARSKQCMAWKSHFYLGKRSFHYSLGFLVNVHKSN